MVINAQIALFNKGYFKFALFELGVLRNVECKIGV